MILFTVLYFILQRQLALKQPEIGRLEDVPILRQGCHSVAIAVLRQALQFGHDAFVYKLIGSPETTPQFLKHVKVTREMLGDGVPEGR